MKGCVWLLAACLVVLSVADAKPSRDRDRERDLDREVIRSPRAGGPPSFRHSPYARLSKQPSYGPPSSKPHHHSLQHGPPKARFSHASHRTRSKPSHHGPSSPSESYETVQTFDRPTRSNYGLSKNGYGPPRGFSSPPKSHRHSGYPRDSKPSSSHGSSSKPKYRKTKYRSSKPVYGTHKGSRYNSTTSFKPSPFRATSSEYETLTSQEKYKPTIYSDKPTIYSDKPTIYSDKPKLLNSYGDPVSYSPHSSGASSSSSPHSSSETSYEDISSLYDSTSYKGLQSSEKIPAYITQVKGYPSSEKIPYTTKVKGKPTESHGTLIEVQPSLSYKLPSSYGDGAGISSSESSYNHGSYTKQQQSSSYPYRISQTPASSLSQYQASFKTPISHGGSATSFISVSHPTSSGQQSEESSASSSGEGVKSGTAVLTSSYLTPDSSYSKHHYGKSYGSYSSPPYSEQISGPKLSTTYRSHGHGGKHHHQHHQQQQHHSSPRGGPPSLDDVQTASSHISAVQAASSAQLNGFKAPTETFGFVPYKQVSVSASVSAQQSSYPAPVAAHSQTNDVAAVAAAAAASGGLSPQDWDAYYGDGSVQPKPKHDREHVPVAAAPSAAAATHQSEQQAPVLSPSYYDPIPDSFGKKIKSKEQALRIPTHSRKSPESSKQSQSYKVKGRYPQLQQQSSNRYSTEEEEELDENEEEENAGFEQRR